MGRADVIGRATRHPIYYISRAREAKGATQTPYRTKKNSALRVKKGQDISNL